MSRKLLSAWSLATLLSLSMATTAQGLDPLPAGVLPPTVYQQSIQSTVTQGTTARLFRTAENQYLVMTRNGQVIKSFRLDVPVTAVQVQGDFDRTEPPPPPPSGNGAVTFHNTYLTDSEVIVVTINYFYVDHKLVDVQVDVKHLPKPKHEMMN